MKFIGKERQGVLAGLIALELLVIYSFGILSLMTMCLSFNIERTILNISKRCFVIPMKMGDAIEFDNLANPSVRPNLMYDYKGYQPPAKGWAISREKMEQWDKEGRLHFPKSPDGRIQRKRYLDELKGEEVPSLWDGYSAYWITGERASRLSNPKTRSTA